MATPIIVFPCFPCFPAFGGGFPSQPVSVNSRSFPGRKIAHGSILGVKPSGSRPRFPFPLFLILVVFFPVKS